MRKTWVRLIALFIFLVQAEFLNGQIVLNELYVRPKGAASIPPNGLIYQGSEEYIELYNKGCIPIDLTGYFIVIKQNIGGSVILGGTLRIPNSSNSIIPPDGHRVLGPTDNINNALLNGNVDITFSSQDVCVYNRQITIPNVDGWIALFSPSGEPLDMVYWTKDSNNINTAASDFNPPGEICLPLSTLEGPTVTLKTAKQIFDEKPCMVSYIPIASPILIYRTRDGAPDWSFVATYDANNFPATINKAITNGNCNGGPDSCTTPKPLAPFISRQEDAAVCQGTGLVVLAGLPVHSITNQIPCSNWKITVNPGNRIITGNTDSVVITDLLAGDYSITVATDGGCEAMLQATITQPLLPIPNISAPASLCIGNDAVFTINGSPGLLVNYSLNGIADSVIIGSEGNVNIIVAKPKVDQTLAIEAIRNDTCFNLISNVAATISFVPISASVRGLASTCTGSVSSVTFVGSRGSAPYTFEYAINDSTIQSVTTAENSNRISIPVNTDNASTLKYKLLKVSDANCSTSLQDSAIITVYNLLITATQTDNTVCNGNSGNPQPCVSEIVINEVHMRPKGANTTPPNGLIYVGSEEYIELYNKGCTPVNVRGWLLAMRSQFSNALQGGVVRIPDNPAAIIPPKGHLVIGSAAPGGFLKGNIDIPLTRELYCILGTGLRIPSVDGWVGLYNAKGIPQDLVYWASSRTNITNPANSGDFSHNASQFCLPDTVLFPAPTTPIVGATQIFNMYQNTKPSLINYVPIANPIIAYRAKDGESSWKFVANITNDAGLGATINKSISGGNCNGGICNPVIPVFASTCNGTATATIAGGTGNYGYEWKDGNGNFVGNTATATALCAGLYSLTVTDLSSGCEGTTTVLIKSIEGPAIKPAIRLENGNTLVSNASTGNQWFLNGNLIIGATDSVYIATQSGSYTVRVTTDSTCTGVFSDAFKFAVTGQREWLREGEFLRLYPNPAGKEIWVNYRLEDAPRNVRLKIFNANGSLLKIISGVSPNDRIDMSGLPNGNLFIQIELPATQRRLVYPVIKGE